MNDSIEIEYYEDSPQERIEELESQLRLLTEKLAFAVDKANDLEQQLRRSQPRPPSPTPSTASSTTNTTPPAKGRFGIWTRRPSSPRADVELVRLPQVNIVPPTPERNQNGSRAPSREKGLPRVPDLLHELDEERRMRCVAETALAQLQGEVEELSASLFSEANNLVSSSNQQLHHTQSVLQSTTQQLTTTSATLTATQAELLATGIDLAREREKSKRLEERFGDMEKRDVERRERIEALEKAVERVGRVRGLVRANFSA
ncbi:hypothetical protein SAICODRAFT_29503 [Saitoella complicata NRRL Y-17804]|uniref:GDP/GTP exchange factor Sec2 N-terminal domain-containing protein n=1 Tax=Saitoella complicata (strain BCRC 22490 / CBS 7301 / JCM 7358 / NBRC 10748 / NRRL Y-17804) TaxID=698492 RepID=A0A0E9N8T6_SAICN|nr:uncharacterized protein SAICODRAFT_29503 [Saitoella complicata NRRL Y-17804]ODQ54354.1 hypothetical protein SAICODRAFT_29503 [Saitoella complicata NRRL Y-17804]GAO45810.1 hypothetical protein G7K_0060-t1 [Saitoella complicata NRRL Y-17804]